MKSLGAGMAGLTALAALGIVGAGVSGVATTPPVPRVAPAVFGIPLPADQVDALPSNVQLTSVLVGLADPAIPFADKTELVQGGIPPIEAAMADRHLQKAEKKGQLPLAFEVANIQPAQPGAASADVTVSGPKLPPRTMNVTFVNQGSWMLSSASAMQLLQAASGK